VKGKKETIYTHAERPIVMCMGVRRGMKHEALRLRNVCRFAINQVGNVRGNLERTLDNLGETCGA